MGREFLLELIKGGMMESMLMIKSRDMECFNGRMDEGIKEIDLMGSNMGREFM